MAAPIAEIEVRWRLKDTGADWRVQRFPPTASLITLTGLMRGGDYEGLARSLGPNGESSEWVPADFLVASESTTPLDQLVLDLDIESGEVVVDCTLSKFRLTLNSNVTGWRFANVPPAKTIRVEIQQWSPGGHTVAYPANVVPVSGRAHVMTPTEGAVDVVTLTTSDSGKTWRLTFDQPVPGEGGVLGVTLSPIPASATSTTDGTTPSAPSVQVTATVVNGTAPTYAWTRTDSNGGTDFLIDNAAIAAPTFSIASGTTAVAATSQTWRVTVTDGDATASAPVTVTLGRTLQNSGTLTLSPNPASASAISPQQPTVEVRAYLTGGSGTRTYAWTRIDTNGGSDFGIAAASGSKATFSMGGIGAAFRQQIWRCTVTDDTGSVHDDVTVSLRRLAGNSGGA